MLCFPTVLPSVRHSVQALSPAGSALLYRLRTPRESVSTQESQQAKEIDSLLLVHRRNHFSVLFQHFGGAGVVAYILVEGGDLRHFVIGQGKIKEVKVRLDMVGILGAGDDNVAVLNVPAEQLVWVLVIYLILLM